MRATATTGASHACSTTGKDFYGGNLEHPGVLDNFLQKRADPISRNLVFLSVGDTRDHRRQYKDPALKNISVDFLLNLLSNLKALGLDNHGILTTPSLCGKLQQKHCLFSCAWTTLLHDHPGLATWGLQAGDMFLMWAQQWHYIARALERGFNVLRTDTDVYFAENPFPILTGPLLRPFDMVVQQDFGGPLGARPSCRRGRVVRERHVDGKIASCGVHRGTALLNIGLVWARSTSPGGGGVLAVINGTFARFAQTLGEPRTRAGQAAPQHVETLIDQPLMRRLVEQLSVGEPGKPSRAWSIVPGGAAGIYPRGAEGTASPTVVAERTKTAFLAQVVVPPGRRAGKRPERIALAPDWLFGRGCLVHVRAPLTLLKRLTTTVPVDETRCTVPPPASTMHAQPAPGPAAGLLVATHFVYSMALKRKRSFRAFGWDYGDARNRTRYPDGAACWRRSAKAMLFSHTFFAQLDAFKAVLCALPSGEAPECSCCAGLQWEAARWADGGAGGTAVMETTGGMSTRWNVMRATKLAEGCTDYQAFWD